MHYREIVVVIALMTWTDGSLVHDHGGLLVSIERRWLNAVLTDLVDPSIMKASRLTLRELGPQGWASNISAMSI